MAVFTAVSRELLLDWLRDYDVGELLDHEGIATGVENTNYFVTTRRGSYVLTLFERLGPLQLPFYLNLMRHLAARGIPCPDPVANRHGALLSTLAGKPAALVTRLPGKGVGQPQVGHCRQVGAMLARMHLAALGYEGRQRNLRGLDWWVATAPRVAPHLDPGQAELLRDEVAHQVRFARSETAALLPESAVHADLFRDNVLFDGKRLGGVIDFYFAGCDSWLFDLAATCNDWCIDDGSGRFDEARLDALLTAYARVRPFVDPERDAWPTMCRAAALRFWLSRLFDLHLPRPAELVSPKDPAHFERVLDARRAGVPPLAAAAGPTARGGH
jgi:homoserine kinase type II